MPSATTRKYGYGYMPRLVDDLLARRLQHHPAVLLVGPRATGKTTTAQRVVRTTIRLDQPAQAAVVHADPDAALRGHEEPVLIDEWQVVPEVLGAVKRAVDTDPRPGRFVLTGSVRGEISAPNWPGTGRLLRIAMYGLTISEVQRRIPAVPLLDRLAEGDLGALDATPDEPLDLRDYVALIARGGFPEPVLRLPASERDPWLSSYVDQLLTRDVAALSPRGDPLLLRRFVEAYALNTAGVVDRRTLEQAAGISKVTADRYEDLLGSLLVADLVPAWWSNRLKRLARSPKRCLVDTAMAMAVVRVNPAGLMRDADLLGRMLDTFVIAQLRAELPRCDTRPRLLHLRQDAGRREIDVIVEYGGGRVLAIEITATSAPTRDDARHLAWFREQLGDRFIAGLVLHTGPWAFDLGERIVAAPVSALWA